MRARLLVTAGAVLMAGCGLLLGLEERELPPPPPPEGGPGDGDGGLTDGPNDDGSTDGATDGGGDACTCAAGCGPTGACLTDVVSIAVGANHNCIVRGNGRLYCMGHNDLSQLAVAGPDRSGYVEITVAGVSWREVSAARDSTCASTVGGDLYCWGSNAFSQLAQDADGGAVVTAPKKVDLGTAKVKTFSVGSHHACAVTDIPTGANMRCWGFGGNGELGLGLDAGIPAELVIKPSTVFGIRGKAVHANDTDATTDGGRTCALTESGIPMCWGWNAANEISTTLPSPVLQATPLETVNAFAVGAGSAYTCELASGAAKKVRCRSGLGTVTPSDCTTSADIFELAMPTGVVPESIAFASTHACLIASNRGVYCFGENDLLQTGVLGSDKCGKNPTTENARRPAVPIRAVGPAGALLEAKAIGVGRGATIVFTTAGTLVGWGRTVFGELGPSPGTTFDGGDAGRTCDAVTCTTPRTITLPP
ncbi:MAG: hypothetical protein JST00_16945 [Deltaproteobacteria bacterium]|nr:hypothetical protein [Deltaproteobacteria bacterium]